MPYGFDDTGRTHNCVMFKGSDNVACDIGRRHSPQFERSLCTGWRTGSRKWDRMNSKQVCWKDNTCP